MKRRPIVAASSADAGSLQSFFALPLDQSLLGGGPVKRVATAGEVERKTSSPQFDSIRGKITVVGWVVVQGLVTGQGQLRRAKAIAAAADLQ